VLALAKVRAGLQEFFYDQAAGTMYSINQQRINKAMSMEGRCRAVEKMHLDHDLISHWRVMLAMHVVL